MMAWRSLILATGLFAMSVTTATLVVTRSDTGSGTRSVGRVHKSDEEEPSTFSRAESTGLFVGVQKFPHDESLTVPYAVDDAVDLAYKFTLDQRSSLIPPQRVVLALSGKPRKEGSQRKLRELRDAGARIENATSGDILHLLNEQVSRAGDAGFFVLALATHGYLDKDGDAYVLGSTSAIGAPETSLRTAKLVDIAGRARRSLVFIDACRDRAGMTSRGAAPNPMTAAPMLRKMGAIEGQVIFYAAAPDQYAYDDDVHENGVFTRAVLEGLECKASAPRGEVIAETLHEYVERAVRRWMEENHRQPISPATQVSMEGSSRNMPLAQCWRSPRFPIRVSVDGTTVTAYDTETRPLWRKDLRQRIVQTAAADLDADAFFEVVVGAGNAITAFDRDGCERWTHNGNGMSLATFTSGDLFRKHTNQIVALWTGTRTSRLTIIDSAGHELASYEHTGPLRHVAVGRPTNMHAPKIAVTGADVVFLLDPKKVSKGAPLWVHALVESGETIEDLRILDADNDSRRDIEVSTKRGTNVFTFDGQILRQSTSWKDVRTRRARR